MFGNAFIDYRPDICIQKKIHQSGWGETKPVILLQIIKIFKMWIWIILAV